MKIIANDGKEFKTSDECIAYEKILEEKNKEKVKRYEEIVLTVAKYNKDYNEHLVIRDGIMIDDVKPWWYEF